MGWRRGEFASGPLATDGRCEVEIEMKVLVCDPIAPQAIERVRAAGIEVDVRDDIAAEELVVILC
jgi:hypothetical protein